jgi:hypothetical protein
MGGERDENQQKSLNNARKGAISNLWRSDVVICKIANIIKLTQRQKSAES